MKQRGFALAYTIGLILITCAVIVLVQYSSNQRTLEEQRAVTVPSAYETDPAKLLVRIQVLERRLNIAEHKIASLEKLKIHTHIYSYEVPPTFSLWLPLSEFSVPGLEQGVNAESWRVPLI